MSISAWVPWLMETITITAAMPMITPSEVNALRIQLPRRAKNAVRRMSVGFMRGLRIGLRTEHAVADLVHGIGVFGDVRVG